MKKCFLEHVFKAGEGLGGLGILAFFGGYFGAALALVLLGVFACVLVIPLSKIEEKYERLKEQKEREKKEKEWEKQRKEREERDARWMAERQAMLDAMTPEERQRYEEKLWREAEADRAKREAEKRLVLGAEDYARISARASSILSGGSSGGCDHAMHDELDAVDRARQITEIYGDDWKGYDPD